MTELIYLITSLLHSAPFPVVVFYDRCCHCKPSTTCTLITINANTAASANATTVVNANDNILIYKTLRVYHEHHFGTSNREIIYIQ
jgi:hypothetical protein